MSPGRAAREEEKGARGRNVAERAGWGEKNVPDVDDGAGVRRTHPKEARGAGARVRDPSSGSARRRAAHRRGSGGAELEEHRVRLDALDDGSHLLRALARDVGGADEEHSVSGAQVAKVAHRLGHGRRRGRNGSRAAEKSIARRATERGRERHRE